MGKEKINPDVNAPLDTPPVTAGLEGEAISDELNNPDELKRTESEVILPVDAKALAGEEPKKEKDFLATIVIVNNVPSLFKLCVDSILKFLHEKDWVNIVVISAEEVEGFRTIVTPKVDITSVEMEAIADPDVCEWFIPVSSRMIAINTFGIFDLSAHKGIVGIDGAVPAYGLFKRSPWLHHSNSEWDKNGLVLPVVSAASNVLHIKQAAKLNRFLWMINESNQGAIEYAASVVYEGEN